MNSKHQQTMAKIFEHPERVDIPRADIDKLFENNEWCHLSEPGKFRNAEQYFFRVYGLKG